MMSGDQLLNAKIKSTCVFLKQNKEKPTMHEDDSPQLDLATALEIGINPKTSSPSTLLRSVQTSRALQRTNILGVKE